MCGSQGANRVASSCGVWQQKEVRSTTVKVDAGKWMLAGSNTEWWAAPGRWKAERTRIVFATADLKSKWNRSQTRGNLLHKVFILQRLLHTYNYTKIWATNGSRWRQPTFQDSIKLAMETELCTLAEGKEESRDNTQRLHTVSIHLCLITMIACLFNFNVACLVWFVWTPSLLSLSPTPSP